MSSAKWRPFRHGPNVFKIWIRRQNYNFEYSKSCQTYIKGHISISKWLYEAFLNLILEIFYAISWYQWRENIDLTFNDDDGNDDKAAKIKMIILLTIQDVYILITIMKIYCQYISPVAVE